MIKIERKNSVALVVAAYRENLDWLNKIKHPIIVYNKNDVEPIVPKNAVVKSIENIGRESQTYLYHIAENYDSLSDVTLFCQGHPFDHCKEFLDIANCKTIQKMNESSKQKDSDRKYPENNRHYAPIGHFWMYDCKYHMDKPWDLQFRIPYTYIALETMYPRHIPLKKFNCIWGAMFAVSKENIHRFPKERWQKLLEYHKQFWSMPWAMETIWHYIFSETDAPKETF